jgi:DnaJ homolog subfamily A member 2
MVLIYRFWQVPGTGLIQQLQQVCKDCFGQRHTIPPAMRCGTCKGMKTRIENHKFDVYIDKGMKDHQKITFQGEGDQAPNFSPGDVIFQIVVAPHGVFRVDGLDLHMNVEISLVEALTGFVHSFDHLDGRKLAFRSEPDSVISPGSVRSIIGEGMPQYKNPFERGQLHIHFSVQFPTVPLSSQQCSVSTNTHFLLLLSIWLLTLILLSSYCNKLFL